MIKMKYKTAIILLAIVSALLPSLLYAGELQTDLNGFRLWQLKPTVASAMGKPFDTFTTDDSMVEAYRLDDKAYMVFEYLKKYQNNIYSMQITGSTDKALPFIGLRLGDDITKVTNILGKPSHITKVESPKVSSYEFEDKNYTVEIDDKNKLYSIKIFITKDLLGKTSESFKAWGEFKAAIVAKDNRRIIEMLRPDVEIYKSGKVLSINQKYADFIEHPDKDFIATLVGDNGSVLNELTETEPEAELRIHEKVGVGEVYKFYKGKILKEIVFYPYNGINRVYEIEFREK
jgi:hypothetical protein